MNQQTHIQIGEIYREHGVKGFCKAYIYSGTDENLFEDGTYWLVNQDGVERKTKLEDVSSVGKFFLLKFSLFQNPEEISSWRKAGIWITKEKLHREEGEKYDFEWEGFQIFDSEEHQIGEVQSIAYTPLKQFVVMHKGHEVLIPYQEEWILEINEDKKIVKMNLPEGLF